MQVMILQGITEYRDILQGDKYAILYFSECSERRPSLDPTYNDMASDVADDMIGFYRVNLAQHHEISDEAMVDDPTLLLVKDGRELERFPRPVPEQLEYTVSQALCGMTKISIIPYEREEPNHLVYCTPAQE
ncbi:thioredoxin family protein [Aspergillus clavatus NRRL 1]|uniref:Uncharacterized protein n=1 Tax=Aspergillus clavatus (strain ATCC 1007 / CBS 513.65 / DSM 816 / NCTC 3887 / NRRL 1 / QM 1276 / 107) TaxID=344612 RepID=A1CSF2_ASPCL|nr:uncharacterized protein ACLA_033090 [Aspergillus clavatus NRRL 1]EAW08573.1 hypothetical protein ACLA_033090 [Aspergillus clavatus NRRL 1]